MRTLLHPICGSLIRSRVQITSIAIYPTTARLTTVFRFALRCDHSRDSDIPSGTKPPNPEEFERVQGLAGSETQIYVQYLARTNETKQCCCNTAVAIIEVLRGFGATLKAKSGTDQSITRLGLR